MSVPFGNRAESIAKAHDLLAVKAAEADQPCALPRPCPCCGGRMLIIETFAPGCEPKYKPNAMPPMIRIDTSSPLQGAYRRLPLGTRYHHAGSGYFGQNMCSV
jgi:hypothetical protein